MDLATLLTAVGAAASGIAGCLLAWAGLVRARREKDIECEQRLKMLRKELRELSR
jgi:hypothetical protein